MPASCALAAGRQAAHVPATQCGAAAEQSASCMHSTQPRCASHSRNAPQSSRPFGPHSAPEPAVGASPSGAAPSPPPASGASSRESASASPPPSCPGCPRPAPWGQPARSKGMTAERPRSEARGSLSMARPMAMDVPGLRIRTPRRARFSGAQLQIQGRPPGAGVAGAGLDHASVTWMTNDPSAERRPPRFGFDRLQARRT